MTNLRELEKRLEEATGGSEDLNIEILHVLHDHGGFAREMVVVPNFTGSLDAAVALVERVLPGWGYFIRKDEEGINASLLYPNALRVSPGCGQHKSSPALALCLALIRTLIAKGDRHD